MRRSVLAGLAVPVVLVALAGCGGAPGATDQAPDQASPAPEEAGSEPPAPRPRDQRIRAVTEARANLYLWVSNQSFEDDPVVVEVAIDGVEVVSEPFAVEGQHNWVLFPLRVPAGKHVLTAESDTGVDLRRVVITPLEKKRYVVLDYWNYDDKDGRYFSLHVSRQPVAFA